ncbi:hypothetical protein [Terrarubrum flagellatum]|uniref:hypothetical protein n=1 Tax=Terrirubrum flagellatum TaxID=2895980 RepID=UPI0031450DFC
MLRYVLRLGLMALPVTVSSTAFAVDDPIQGQWARAAHDCRARDSLRLVTIDFNNRQDGKLAPLIKRGDDRCGVQGISTKSQVIRIEMVCSNAWEIDPLAGKSKLFTMQIKAINKDELLIDNVRHVRCAE